MTDIRWHHDPVVAERLTRRYGVTVEPVHIELPDIDRRKSAQFQNRPQAENVDANNVTQFVASARAGEMIPAIVVWAVPGGFVVLDGNHRLGMTEALQGATIGAWRVNATEDTAVEIAGDANLFNGAGVDHNYRMGRALHYSALGYSPSKIAQRLNVHVTTVREYLARHEQETRIGELIGSANLSKSKVTALRRIEDEPLKVLGEVLLKQSHQIIGEVATELADVSPSKRLAKAHELRGQLKEMTAQKSTDRRARELSELRRGLTTAHKTMAKAWSQATVSERRTLRDQIARLVERMNTLDESAP